MIEPAEHVRGRVESGVLGVNHFADAMGLGVAAVQPRAEDKLLSSAQREIKSEKIGELVMRELKRLDKVAYIRFASVYRSFQDVDDFRDAIEAVAKPQPKRRRTTAGR